MTQPRLREATERDASAVAEVLFAAAYHDALTAGLPPRIADPQAARGQVAHLLGVDPLSGVLVEVDGQPIGMGWGHSRGRVATIGPVAVLPGWRGQGHGSAILAHVIDQAARGTAQVRVLDDGSPAALACCVRAGFRVVAPVLELALASDRPCTVPELAGGTMVREATLDDRDAIVERDARFFGARREQDVDHALEFGRIVLAERGGRVLGHAIALALEDELVIGAAGADDAAIVLGLVADHVATGRADGATTRLLVPSADQQLIESAMDAGFRVERSRAYLARGGGTAPPRGYVLMPLGRC